jgi:hypothetical protein
LFSSEFLQENQLNRYFKSPIHYTVNILSLRALPATDTELKLIAAAAIIGLSKKPKVGYKTPAATGTLGVVDKGKKQILFDVRHSGEHAKPGEDFLK